MSPKLSALSRWFREHYDVTQESFAHGVGATQGHVSSFTNGNAVVSDALLERISRRTRIPIETLAADNAANRAARDVRNGVTHQKRTSKQGR